MRNLLFAAVAVSLLFAAGCDTRDSLAVVPDRQGHAGGPDAKIGVGGATRVAHDDESYYTVKDGDTLKSIAGMFNTSEARIIERNDIRDLKEVKAGKNLIVPKVGIRKK